MMDPGLIEIANEGAEYSALEYLEAVGRRSELTPPALDELDALHLPLQPSLFAYSMNVSGNPLLKPR
jgi:hypothetical protein